jgi:hypothetical protein
MEPTNLTPPSDREDELEALLRRPHAPLPDNGFSARVVMKLSAPPNWSRLWFAIVGGGAGVIFAMGRGASGEALQKGIDDLKYRFVEVGAIATDPWFWVALGIIAVSMVYTFRSRDSGFLK